MDLPVEILQHVFRYLPCKDKISAFSVSKTCEKLIQGTELVVLDASDANVNKMMVFFLCSPPTFFFEASKHFSSPKLFANAFRRANSR
jgi:hypothetical protein